MKISQVKGKIWSDCTKSSGNILKPIKGNAVLFFNVYPNTTTDSSSSHARCPVLEGEMWFATKIFQVNSTAGKKLSEDDECTDQDENCPVWAALGECQKNPVFMVGSPDYYGTCRKSCKECWCINSTMNSESYPFFLYLFIYFLFFFRSNWASNYQQLSLISYADNTEVKHESRR